MKRIDFLILLLLSIFVLEADIIEYNVISSNPQISDLNGYSKVIFENTIQSGETGSPTLPYYGIQLLLPQGHKAVSISVEGSGLREVQGYHVIYPVQPQKPLSMNSSIDFVAAVDPVYSSLLSFPENLDKGFRTDYYAGYSIASVAVTPLQYVPATGNIAYYQTLKVTIETAPLENPERLYKFVNDRINTVNVLHKTVNNIQALESYSNRTTREFDTDYLIIAEESKIELWQELAAIHNSFGRIAEIVSIESILANNQGVDDPEKIRNFLIEQYEEQAIQYVLLAGDTDVIPHRGLYGIVNASSQDPTADYDIPADMYYSCLDRGSNPGLGPDWNNDQDNMWGEQDEADLIPEFAIGRFPYNNDQEIVNFINKVNLYLNSPVTDEVTTALFVGEDLGWAAWGGEYMDEMIGGSDNFGYSTTGVPTEWDISTLYDMDAYWSQNDLYDQLNAGPNLLSHLGHSSTQYTMKLNNNNVNTTNITNDGIDHNFTVIFTQGCYGGAFDNRNSNGSYVGDCITEKFAALETGAVSMIAHSRFGWGSSYDTNGASQHYNREYNDAIFGEDIFQLGNALLDAKIDAIPFMSSVMYWVAYETNLIGDPGLTIWTSEPGDIVLSHASDIIIGSQHIDVTSSVPDVNIAVFNGADLIGFATTDGTNSTSIEFEYPLESLGQLTIKASKHNYLNYTNSVNIIPASGPYVICNAVEYQESGSYLDGIIQSLDTVNLNVTLNNIGLEDVTGDIDAYLTTEFEQVDIVNDHTLISGLASLEEIVLENAFQIELISGINDNTVIEFQVELVSGTESWQSTIFLTVHAPVLVYDHYDLIPTSGDDLSLDPGESAELYITFRNEGGGFSYQLNTSLYSYDPFISVNGFSMESEIAPGDEVTTSTPFNIFVLEECPLDYFVELEVLAYDIVASGLFTTFSIPVGLTGYNFENAVEWEHASLSNGYSDEWHLEAYRNHTDNGSFSMKCGGSGSSEYSASLHAGMTSPVIPLSGGTMIKFWHWMDAETQNASTAWDGGLVEASFNSGDFSPLQPVNGYPYTIVDNQDSPFDPGIPVFSGSHGWEEVEFDLSGYTGVVQLRFVFGTDGYVNGEGWYIDDITIENNVDTQDDIMIPVVSELKQNYPNPFNPITNICFSVADPEAATEISIYNVKGQKVVTLIDDLLPAGEYNVTWEGKNSRGNNVGSGIYFAKFRSGRFTNVKKMILMK